MATLRRYIRRIEQKFHLVLGVYFISIILMLMYWALILQPKAPSKRHFSNTVAMETDVEYNPAIIVTYMRSGSTFLGDILQQDPDVFYVFEPLHDTQASYIKHMESIYPGQQFKGKLLGPSYYEEALPLLSAWFTCNFTYLTDEASRTHVSFFKYGKKTSLFLDCVTSLLKNSGRSKNDILGECVEVLERECSSSKFRLIKTIRLGLNWVSELFSKFPYMKVIYLLRDPRATIASQMRFGECDSQHGGIHGCSKFLCSSIEQDLSSYRAMSIKHSGQISIVKYEDLARNPLQTSQELYDFIGTSLQESIKEYIHAITSAGKNPVNVMSNIRANSSAQINKWKLILRPNQTAIIQTNCRYLLREFEYAIW